VAQGDKEVLNLYELIGAPLLAVVQAESQAAQVSAQFIKQIGFTQEESPSQPGAVTDRDLEQGGHFGDLKMVHFRHQARDPQGRLETRQLDVPALSLFPIPLLQVKHAEFDFAIRILDHESRGPEHRPDTPVQKTDRLEFLSKNRVELKGAISQQQPQIAGQRTTAMALHVKIRMEQADMPAGLMKMLSVLDQSITSTPLATPPVTGPTADAGTQVKTPPQ
jgi:hypothetical protein